MKYLDNPTPDICIHCYAPGCEDDTVIHSQTCPQSTGLWPITELDIEQSTVCAECAEPFEMGGYYVQVPLDEWQEYRNVPTVVLTCLVCALCMT